MDTMFDWEDDEDDKDDKVESPGWGRGIATDFLHQFFPSVWRYHQFSKLWKNISVKLDYFPRHIQVTFMNIKAAVFSFLCPLQAVRGITKNIASSSFLCSL